MSRIANQVFPYPEELDQAVKELIYLPGWRIELEDMDRGQGCRGLTLKVYPDKPDSYHPERHVNTLFTFPVPAAAFNRESWEEWLWARIEDVENHERAEWFRFNTEQDGMYTERRPFKPAHQDGWDPSVVRTVVSETTVNTPNAGRWVKFPCPCGHLHPGRMGEHFTITQAWACPDSNVEGGCPCPLGRREG